MNARLSARLIRYSIEHATESAGMKRRKRGNGDVYAICAVLLSIAAAVVVIYG